MKILAGRFKGREIPFRPNRYLRPTPDRVRHAIMQSLAGVIGGSRILDVFCGTGALGLEALSQGASEVHFIEKHRPLCLSLKKLTSRLGPGADTRLVCHDARGPPPPPLL